MLDDLSHIDQEPDYLELINYALEALEYDTDVYFNVKVSRGTRSSNSKKKDSGIYYTPLDVANFIVSQCVDTAYTLCNISGMSISKYVPKISNSIEKVCCERISAGSSNLYSLFEHSNSGHPLIVNGTAYNWLCAYDHIPPSVDENEKPYMSGATRIYHLPDRASHVEQWYFNQVNCDRDNEKR